ncbi:MAG TPA: DegT/DnrJ/EryC1/StrS family aminotransferase [Planctomycetota bacterium]|nr:DegT/DnrJ/EryC1/StrS family aminotransferase [Planctomycetota bacterium]
MLTDERLAIDGGRPARTAPYGSAPRFGIEEEAAALAALRSQILWSLAGGRVRALEEDLRALYGVRHAIACSSGTAAVHAALAACGIGPGDEVVVNPITDWGSVGGILALGAIPVFCDIGLADGSLDPQAVAAALTPRTRAILLVHLHGIPARAGEIAALARARSLALVEDCAQAPWAEVDGRRVGTFGDVAAFSANDSKHVSCGEGGWILVGDDDLAARARRFCDKGYLRDAPRGGIDVVAPGLNYRLSELAAAVLRPQLARLPAAVGRRRSWAARLLAALADVDGWVPLRPAPGAEGAWWTVLGRLTGAAAAAGQERIVAALAAEGVPAGAALSPARLLYRVSALAGRARVGPCPRAEALAGTALFLPCSDAYGDLDADETAGAVRKVLAAGAR